MKKGKLIGTGMTSEVYEWGQDCVLKLYHDEFNDAWIERENNIGTLAHEAGVPSPALFDKVEVDGHRGIVFERIFGTTMLRHADAEPWKLVHFSRQMARLHFQMHQCSAPQLPSQKDKFTAAIKRSSEILGDKEKIILDYLERLPDGASICHGDLHFDNIIVSNRGLIVIDWTNGYNGNPLGDVARTCLMLHSPTRPPEIDDTTAASYKQAKLLTYTAYLREYLKLSNARFEDINAWMLPLAAARLKEKVPREEKWLMDMINTRLEQLRKR